jgi:hypothetical protein
LTRACSASPACARARSASSRSSSRCIALFGLFYINAQYLQDVKGYSPLLAGVCILPLAVVMPDASARSTHLAARIGGGCGLALAPLS